MRKNDRKIIGILILVVAVTAIFIAVSVHPGPSVTLMASQSVTVGVEVADTPIEREQGLMYREQLPEGQGMLFIFPDDDYRTFWMKNTLIPLDIIFISGDGRIVDIKRDFQPCKSEPCEVYGSKIPAKYVLEVNSGFTESHGLVIGNRVAINNIQ